MGIGDHAKLHWLKSSAFPASADAFCGTERRMFDLLENRRGAVIGLDPRRRIFEINRRCQRTIEALRSAAVIDRATFCCASSER
jgi:hypothetical protein